MKISQPIYTSQGIILLKEGTVLTQRYIDKILKLDLKHIYIQDELSKNINIEKIISEETKIETKKILERSIETLKSGRFNIGTSIILKVEEIINEVILNPRIMISMQEIRSKDEYLHMHSINVCIISLLMGKELNYNEVQLKHLAIGAILHDIGKINVDFDFSRYREDYIEEEFRIYKQHVNEGYEIVQSIPETSLISANIVKYHHEKYDGTGFPYGLKGDAILDYAKIVAIANEYDNLIYNLSSEKTLKHYEIIELIIAKAYTSFDPDIIKVFAGLISPYPIATGVELSDGRIGIISKTNPNFPTRPTVRIIDSNTMQAVEEVDLSKTLSILIIGEKNIDK